MGNTEKGIIELAAQQQDMSSAELSSKASSIAAIASLAAFVVMQWIANPDLKIIAWLLGRDGCQADCSRTVASRKARSLRLREG